MVPCIWPLFPSLIIGKIMTINTGGLKIKIRRYHHTYIPVLILRPSGYVSQHPTFLSPRYQLHHGLLTSAQMPLCRKP